MSGAETTFCLLKRSTGIPCPGCGMTRSLAALASGDLPAAVSAHLLGPLLAVEALAVWLWAGVRLGRRRRLRSIAARWLEPVLLGHLLGLVALWVGRAASGTLPW